MPQRQSLERADVVIRLIDATTLDGGGILPDEEFVLRDDQTCITVANKTDLCPTRSLPEGVIALSAKEGRGVDALCERLLSVVPTNHQEGATIVSSLRHYEALTIASKKRSYLDIVIHKTQAAVKLPLSPTAIELLGKPKKRGLVFPDLTGYKLSFYIPRLLKLAKIEKHITFHCLRHSISSFSLKTNDLQNLNLRQVTI